MKINNIWNHHLVFGVCLSISWWCQDPIKLHCASQQSGDLLHQCLGAKKTWLGLTTKGGELGGTKYLLPWLSTWRLDLCEFFVWVSQFSCLPTWAKQWLVDFGRDIFPLPLFQCGKFQVWKIAYENRSLWTWSSPEVDFTFPKTTSVEKRLKDSCFSFDINTDLSQMGKKVKQKAKGNIMNSSKRKWFSGWPSKFPCEVNFLFWKPPNKTATYLSHEQKPFYFPLYCLLKNGILIMVYDNPHITG